MDKYKKILKQYWGYPEFRSLQHEIISSVGEGKDTLALMPTGGGKSITFQVPAMAKDGICIVVTPLIALMKDQVENLQERKIKATAVYAGLTKREIDIALENCVHDFNMKFLYCSPERLQTEIFRVRVQQMNVNLLAIDESHCISQWGYDFRPSYLKIAELRQLIPNVPVLAVTATATVKVVDDIQEKLAFREKNVFRKSFERKNLVYLVRETEDKQSLLLKITKSIKGSGIVYVRSRQKTKEIALFLEGNGVQADYYHAGLSTTVRHLKQSDWKKGQTRVMVSTNAFGMGIDKPNVRFVVHIDLPDSLEAYFQEAGRAGRDEKQAFAVLLFHPGDATKLERRIETTFPPVNDIQRVYQALGNFFELSVGSGKAMSFDFDLPQFIKVYRFNALLVYNSLKILERSNYLEFSEEVDNPSRIMFVVQRDFLYKYQVANAKEDVFIKLLLRSYEGLFSQYKAIDEQGLAMRVGTTKDVVSSFLIKLSRDKIISYIPRKKVPQIFYVSERLESSSLFIAPEIYKNRKEDFSKRIHSVIDYATDNKCRSKHLLEYFGQENPPECGVCDVCTSRSKVELSKNDFDSLMERIENSLNESPKNLEQLTNSLRTNSEKVIKLISWLLDNNKIHKDQTGNLFFNKL